MTIPTPNKTFTVSSSGHKYEYIYYPPSKPQKQTLLFLHGFPSTSHDWRHQITHFKTQGYGILAPDLLGYGNSSKPLSPSSYFGSIMSSDIISILDHEQVQGSVVGIAHDWGTYLLSQLAVYYEVRFEKFVFMNIPFTPPGRKLDVEMVNKSTKEKVGYEQFGYWLFLTDDGAGKTIGKHWESFFDIVFCANPDDWKTHFAPIDSLKNFITTNSHVPVASYITPADKAHHHAVFGDDYSACVRWYHRGIQNLGAEEEKILLKEGKINDVLGKETLMITGTRDAVCGATHAEVSMRASVKQGKLAVEHLHAGHWVMLEQKEQCNKVLSLFFGDGVQGVEGKVTNASL